MPRNPSLPLVLAAVLAACAPLPEPMPPVPMPPEDACGASALQGLVGQPESALALAALPDAVRVIRPGMAVTMDYSPTRLNVELDDAGQIQRVSCG